MSPRNSEDLVIGAIWLIFDTIIYAFIVSAVNLQLISVIPLGILAFTFFLTIFLWRRHEVRTRALVLSQRPVVYLIFPPLAGIALGLLVLTLLMRFTPHISLLESLGLSYFWLTVAASGGVFLLVTIICEIICWRINRLDITASRCYYVVRKIDRLSAEEKYRFESEATLHSIRRESRILDQLKRHKNACVKHSFLLRYTIVPNTDVLHGLSTDSITREEELAIKANELWQEGGNKRHWHAYGKPVEPLQFHNIFGNQLDDLFNNTQGFRIYDTGGPRFVTMVIKGPPGAGKSTLALQMCVSLACQGNFCMYYSLEEEREGLLKSAQNYGWDNAEEPPYDKNGEPILRAASAKTDDQQPTVSAADAQQPVATAASIQPDATKATYRGVQHSSFQHSRGQLKTRQTNLKKLASGKEVDPQPQHTGGIVLVSSLGGRAMRFRARMRRLRKVWGGPLGNIGDLPEVARCVVIDSLEGFANVGLEHEGQIAVPRSELIALKDFFRDRCQMLVIVVEDDGSNKPGFVDFVADTVVQLGRREDAKTEYTILTAEILKARNQKHALGQHQLKIISKEDIANATGAAVQIVQNLIPGIQVFPSLHFHLSLSARQDTFDEHFLSTGLAGLDEMFNGDPNFLPVGGTQLPAVTEPLIKGKQLRLRRPSANALLGPGGTAKSMIAMNFLIEGIRENTKTLLLSFRDDEGTIINRAIAQGSGRMRFTFEGAMPSYYHTFEWNIDDIAYWVRSEQRPARLPYLFKQGPASYEKFQADRQLQAEADAVQDFLKKLAECCPTNHSWNDDARRRLKATYDDACRAFVAQMRPWLVLVAPDTPKTLILDEGTDERLPRLMWNSRYIPERQPDKKWDTTLRSNTELLQILALRPGNITPEDFVARILRIIGDTHENRQYERVVFDDVSQLQHGFPLLANSQLLLRTLIDIFKAKGMTSLFIADTASGREDELDHGLADMSDHVLRTQVRYRDSDSGLRERGAYVDRVIVIDLEGRPGLAQQAPHMLWVSKSNANIIEMERLP